MPTDNRAHPSPPLLAPRHWPTWAGLGLMWCAAQLPYRLQLALGRRLGGLLHGIGGRRRRIAEVNLRLCRPELTPQQRRALLRRHFESVGIALFETALSWFAPAGRLRPLVEVEGLEHVQAAFARGRGAIVLIGHFTTMELVARLLALHLPLHVSYREHKNPVYQHVLAQVHGAHCASIIGHTDLRAMYRALKANEALWYSPDQNYAGKHSAFAPFFGVPASTITATTRIAATSGAPVIPLRAERRADGRGYRITLQAPVTDYPSGDPVADATHINQIIETHARAIPEQYLWVHRRFKTRPPGAPRVYD